MSRNKVTVEPCDVECRKLSVRNKVKAKTVEWILSQKQVECEDKTLFNEEIRSANTVHTTKDRSEPDSLYDMDT